MRYAIAALVLVLGLGPGEAEAGKKVDWSQYLEEPGSRSNLSKMSSKPVQPAKAERAKVAKAGAKAKRGGAVKARTTKAKRPAKVRRK